MSHVTRHTSHVTRHTSHVIRHTSHVTRHPSHVTRHTSHVTRHTLHVTRHTPHVTRHTSHVTRHTSHVIRQRVTHESKSTCDSVPMMEREGSSKGGGAIFGDGIDLDDAAPPAPAPAPSPLPPVDDGGPKLPRAGGFSAAMGSAAKSRDDRSSSVSNTRFTLAVTLKEQESNEANCFRRRPR
jgi:hypothetical protein